MGTSYPAASASQAESRARKTAVSPGGGRRGPHAGLLVHGKRSEPRPRSPGRRPPLLGPALFCSPSAVRRTANRRRLRLCVMRVDKERSLGAIRRLLRLRERNQRVRGFLGPGESACGLIPGLRSPGPLGRRAGGASFGSRACGTMVTTKPLSEELCRLPTRRSARDDRWFEDE